MTISKDLKKLGYGYVGQVEWVINRIAELIDLGRSDEIVDILGSECFLEFGEGSPFPGRMNGIEAVSKFFIDRANNSQLKTKHIVSNLNISVFEEGKIEAKYIFTVYRGAAGSHYPENLIIADVIDVYSAKKDSLKLIQRTVTPSFQVKLKI